MPEFTTPDFLLNHSTDEIHKKMIEILPSDLDLSEGGHGWNMTRPTALVGAELCEFILPEVIKLIFPEWSYGEFLDGHAKARGITRRAAVAASGKLTIRGEHKTLIPAGSLFSTATINEEPSVDYATIEDAEIPEDGYVEVDIQCTQTGVIGNTGASTIVLVSSKLTGITLVTNDKEITGGTEEEDDESLRERINEYDKSQGESFTGSIADYKRWATTTEGVGDATVIPATDDSGLVTIIITDPKGVPATPDLCTKVYNKIMRPDDPGQRLAPCNALLSVVPPETTDIGIKATIELKESTIDAVREEFATQLALYMPVALEEGEVKLTRVAAVLAGVDGVNDFKDLQIGIKTDSGITYGTANIPITTSQLPTVAEEDINLTSGTI